MRRTFQVVLVNSPMDSICGWIRPISAPPGHLHAVSTWRCHWWHGKPPTPPRGPPWIAGIGLANMASPRGHGWCRSDHRKWRIVVDLYDYVILYIYITLYNMSESCGNWIQHTRFVTSSAKSYLSHLWHCSMSQRTPSLQKSSTINIKDHQRESQFQEFSLQLNLHCSWRTSSLWSGHNGTIARFWQSRTPRAPRTHH